MAFKKILCAIDFSAGSERAMRVAIRLANQSEAELVLAHVWYVPPLAITGQYTLPAEVMQALADDAQTGLDAASRDATTSFGARQVTTRLMNGPPWREIVTLLESEAFDLAVLGTRGRSGLDRILLGTVAEKVVRHAPCSTLTVRPDAETKSFTHIVCPVDFSESSQHAVDLAAEVAQRDGATITLLHIIEIPVAYSGEPIGQDFLRDLDKRSAGLLSDLASQLERKMGISMSVHARIGRPGADTLRVLDHDQTIDLVVMGSHGRTGIKRALLGSVAEKVVRNARCPVLVARKRI